MSNLREQDEMPRVASISAKERLCPRCGGSSLKIPFYHRKTGRLSSHCIECEKIVVNERYRAKKKELEGIPGGFCKCGCGGRTTIAVRTSRCWGHVAGRPVEYINRHSRRLSPVDYIIEDRGYKTPCWIWQLSKDDEGYGFITVPVRESGSRTGRAHTVYYERKYGKMPEGLLPDHLCRVPSCVNPDHIEPVTCAENVRRGKSTKLCRADVDKIRLCLDRGELQDNLAVRFGVTQTLISHIKKGTIWRENS
jgi:hypothetical protein